MTPEIADLALEIVRSVDDHQPGIVAVEFTDAGGRRHTIIDKALISAPSI